MKINIGGFDYTVEENNDIAEQGSLFGSTHHNSQKIFIKPNTTKQQKTATLIHEVMHVIWFNTGLRSRDNIREHEEEIIDALSNGIYQVLKDNKGLWK